MIIAECCQNHNGDMKILKDMVQAAEGADFIKIQSFFADDLSPQWKHDYDRVKKLQLTWDEHALFCEWCREVGAEPMTSVYTDRYKYQIKETGFNYVKFGSAQSSDNNLYNAYKNDFKVVISWGGRGVSEIPHTNAFASLHCVSKYPTPIFEADIGSVLKMRARFAGSKTKIGFSGHTDPIGFFQYELLGSTQEFY